jgi:hypothetical protein
MISSVTVRFADRDREGVPANSRFAAACNAARSVERSRRCRLTSGLPWGPAARAVVPLNDPQRPAGELAVTSYVASGGDNPAGEVCAGGDPGAVVVVGGAADVFTGLKELGVALVLFEDHVEAFDAEIISPGCVSAAGITHSHACIRVPILQCGGDQAAWSTDNEVGQIVDMVEN